jgi:ring-1,2-phenylacetyl-CoA epoxidase subunit PaaC
MQDLINYTLQLADNSLIYGHRLSEWCGHGPALEVDIALSNIALDNLGAARSFYQYAATLQGGEATEDTLAYLRTEREFKNILMVELPNGNFADTIARAFYFDAFQLLFYKALQLSNDATIAGIAAKSLKEVTYHFKYSSEWVIRLGDGTPESKEKMQRAIDNLYPYSGEVFLASDVELNLQTKNIAPDCSALYKPWQTLIEETLENATLQMPEAAYMQRGGKKGIHTEHLGFILAEMQHLQRVHPGATW